MNLKQNGSKITDGNKNLHKKNNSISSYAVNSNKKIISNKISTQNKLKSKNNSLNKQNNFHQLSPNFTFGKKFSSLLNLKPPTNIITNYEKIKIDVENSSIKEYEDNENKLKESITTFSQNIRKNEGASVNTLFKVRTVLLNWLKDSELDNLEYSKFMTEKKIKYLLKNKDKLEFKFKQLETELNSMKSRKIELESILGDIYQSYEIDELELEIERFSNSYEIRTGKSSKMMEKFEEMKKMLPLLKEFYLIKEQEIRKTKEKTEIDKISKSSLQTLGFLTNYYKNLRKKINDMTIIN